MSYCRWSTDNFNCDIYAYESDSGYVIHVASKKYNGDIPKTDYQLLMSGEEENIKEYIRQSKVRSEYLNKCGTHPIGLLYDGETFVLDTVDDFFYKMVELKNVGYKFPDHVFEIINEERKEKI